MKRLDHSTVNLVAGAKARVDAERFLKPMAGFCVIVLVRLFQLF
jgi:hypothetical protein